MVLNMLSNASAPIISFMLLWSIITFIMLSATLFNYKFKARFYGTWLIKETLSGISFFHEAEIELPNSPDWYIF